MYRAEGWIGVQAVAVDATPLVQTVAVETYRELGLLPRAGVHAALTIAVGVIVLGMLPGYSDRVVETARRSTIISIVVGVPTAAVLAALVATGHVISDTNIGVFFAIPLVTVGFTVLPPATALGYTVLGATVASRLGVSNIGVWLVVGGLVSGLVAISTVATIAVGVVAAVVGTGAGIRVAMNSGLSNEPEGRAVPPANKV